MRKLLKFVIIGFAVVLILFVAFIGYFMYEVTHSSTRQEVASDVSIYFGMDSNQTGHTDENRKRFSICFTQN